jgi:hypothetical protein
VISSQLGQCSSVLSLLKKTGFKLPAQRGHFARSITASTTFFAPFFEAPLGETHQFAGLLIAPLAPPIVVFVCEHFFTVPFRALSPAGLLIAILFRLLIFYTSMLGNPTGFNAAQREHGPRTAA